jgi:4-amino-4-deoxychorismate lyase
MNTVALVDGHPTTTIEIHDRGLQFGDGVFETLRVRGGRPLLWELHWERLQRGLRQLRIPLPDPAQCLDEIRAHAPATEVLAKLIVTRGSSPRGYAVPDPMQSRRVLLISGAGPTPSGSGHERDLRVGICSTLAHTSPVPGAKHLNRLENVLARMDWQESWDEGLMLSPAGHLVCGTASNVFLAEGDSLLTPPVKHYGIAGTRRRWLIDHAQAAGIAVREECISRERLMRNGRCWLTSTVLGIREGRLIADTHDAVLSDGDHSPEMRIKMNNLAKCLHEMA